VRVAGCLETAPSGGLNIYRYFSVICCSLCTIIIDVADSTETAVCLYKTTRRCNQANNNLNFCLCAIIFVKPTVIRSKFTKSKQGNGVRRVRFL
jgi:hypothetical protein